MDRCRNSRMRRIQDFLKEAREIARLIIEIYVLLKPMLHDIAKLVARAIILAGVLRLF